MHGLPIDNMNEMTALFFYDCFARLAREVKGNEYQHMKDMLIDMDIPGAICKINSMQSNVSIAKIWTLREKIYWKT